MFKLVFGYLIGMRLLCLWNFGILFIFKWIFEIFFFLVCWIIFVNFICLGVSFGFRGVVCCFVIVFFWGMIFLEFGGDVGEELEGFREIVDCFFIFGGGGVGGWYVRLWFFDCDVGGGGGGVCVILVISC